MSRRHSPAAFRLTPRERRLVEDWRALARNPAFQDAVAQLVAVAAAEQDDGEARRAPVTRPKVH